MPKRVAVTRRKVEPHTVNIEKDQRASFCIYTLAPNSAYFLSGWGNAACVALATLLPNLAPSVLAIAVWVLPSAQAYTGAEGVFRANVPDFFRAACFSLGFGRE